jgi:hypothetical protein
MIELQTSAKQDDTTRTRTPKPGYLNLSISPLQGRTQRGGGGGMSLLINYSLDIWDFFRHIGLTGPLVKISCVRPWPLAFLM